MALQKASPLAAYWIDDTVTSAEEAAAKGLIEVESKDGVPVFGTYAKPKKG